MTTMFDWSLYIIFIVFANNNSKIGKWTSKFFFLDQDKLKFEFYVNGRGIIDKFIFCKPQVYI